MLLEKDFVMQGGVRNYLGNTEEVTAPKFWQSSKNSPKTELAYITEKEKGLLADANLHGSLKNGKPNIGASGLLSYDGWGDVTSDGTMDTSMSSAGAEGGQGSGSSGNTGYQGGNNNNNNNNQNDNRQTYSATTQYETTPQFMGTVDAEDEYLAPDKDHWKATQKAIKKFQKGDNYQADYSDWSKESREAYQLEMNKLKGTEGKNYSFYKGNEGTTNLSFSEHWKDVPATNPVLANLPIARLLIAAGRTLQENFTTDYGTARYGGAGTDGSSLRAIDGGGWLGMLFNSDGTVKEDLSNDDYDRIYNAALPDLPYLVGGSQPQETSMVNEYFANANNQNLGISSDYMTTYNKAKEDLAKTLNMTANADQFGYSGTMTASNIYYNYLKEQGLL